jgi:transcriptional regulator with XRE-family HTH domain
MTLPDREASSRQTTDWEQIVESIGPKVHQVRQQLGLSLQQLASRSGVSAAAIHKVERGDMVPTITTLFKLSTALGRPIAYFVDDSGRTAPVAVHLRASERPSPSADRVPPGDGVTAQAIAVPTEWLRGGAVHAVVAPGGSSGSAGDARPLRPGEELLLVLHGQLSVEVAGERYLVAAGDTLHYPTDRPNSWWNPGSEPAHVVWWYLDD